MQCWLPVLAMINGIMYIPKQSLCLRVPIKSNPMRSLKTKLVSAAK